MRKFTDEALEAAAELSARYLTDRFLPDKAIDVIDEAGRARPDLQHDPPAGYQGAGKADRGNPHEKRRRRFKHQKFEEAAIFRDEERVSHGGNEQVHGRVAQVSAMKTSCR